MRPSVQDLDGVLDAMIKSVVHSMMKFDQAAMCLSCVFWLVQENRKQMHKREFTATKNRGNM